MNAFDLRQPKNPSSQVCKKHMRLANRPLLALFITQGLAQ